LKRILLAALAAGLLMPVAPSANASPSGETYSGGCSLNTGTDPSQTVGGQDVFTGQLSVRTVTYSSNPAENPVSATVTCEVRVNDVPQTNASVTASGPIAQAGAKVVTYVRHTNDIVDVCITVSFSPVPGTVSSCAPATTITIPPKEVNDLIAQYLDPAICAILIALAPGVPPAVTIDPTGDTEINGAPFWDCPPYVET
jgi:hypothetical protein